MGSTKKYASLIDNGFNLHTTLGKKIFKCEFSKNEEIICKIKFYSESWENAVEYSEKIKNCLGTTLLQGTKTEIKQLDKF